ncbi:MAG TPA: SPASM domain-containing protein, partial [Vicinamibacteria bacterium]
HLVWKRCHSWGNVIETSGSEQQQAAARAAAAGLTPDAHTGGPGGAAQAREPQAAGAAGFTPDAHAGGPGGAAQPPAQEDTYCPAPYDQFVVQWNGDVVSCCTDYEGSTKTANVFTDGIEAVWRSDVLKQRRQDMLEGRLLDVCAKCEGVKHEARWPA